MCRILALLCLPILVGCFHIPQQSFGRDGLDLNLYSVPDDDDVVILVTAPFYQSVSPRARNGSVREFEDSERLQLVLQHPDDEFVDLQIGPYGHHQLGFYGRNRRIRHSLPVFMDTWISGPTWTGKIVLPRRYLPSEPKGISAFSTHKDGPSLNTWSMNPISESDANLDVHHPSLSSPVKVARSIDGVPARPSRIWNNARKGILVYDADDDEGEEEPPFSMTFQGFERGVECNMTVPYRRPTGSIPGRMNMVFKNANDEAMMLEMLPNENIEMRAFRNPYQEIPIDELPKALDYRSEIDPVNNVWRGSVLIPPDYFPSETEDVNMYVEYEDDDGFPTETRHWTEDEDDENEEPDDDFDEDNFRPFERELVLMDNKQPSPFWEKLLQQQPAPTRIRNTPQRNIPQNPTREPSLPKEQEPTPQDEDYPRRASQPDYEKPQVTPHEQEARQPFEEQDPLNPSEEISPSNDRQFQREPTPDEVGIPEHSSPEVDDRTPYYPEHQQPTRPDPNSRRRRPQQRRRKIQDDSEPNISVIPTRLSKKIPSNADSQRHPFEERPHKNTFKVVINPHLKGDEQNPPLEVTPSNPEEISPRQPDETFLKLKILDDDRPSKDGRRIDPSDQLDKNSPQNSDSDNKRRNPIDRERNPQPSAPNDPDDRNLEDMILEMLRRQLEKQSQPENHEPSKNTPTPTTPQTESTTTEAVTDNILDSMLNSDNLFPPPHPVCFTDGLVADDGRCEVFHECVLKDNEWEMYSWMCKPGTIFDQYRSACLAGTCVR